MIERKRIVRYFNSKLLGIRRVYLNLFHQPDRQDSFCYAQDITSLFLYFMPCFLL